MSLALALTLGGAIYLFALLCVWFLPSPAREKAVWLLPLGWIALFLVAGAWLSPVARLVFSTAILLGLIKCAVALKRPRAELRDFSKLGLAIYFTIWPGVALGTFAKRQTAPTGQDRALARDLFRCAGCAVAGLALLIAVGWNAPLLSFQTASWLAIAALLLVAHFGIGAILPFLVRQIGFAVGPLFRAPEQADSLADFWSRRWNLPFVEMDRLLFLRPFRKRFGARGALIGVFVVSGLLHELGISYPAGAGWGGPLLYFLLQGVLVLVEPRLPSKLRRVGAWLAIGLPLPLLFHAPFRAVLIGPLLQWLHELLHQRPFDWYFSLGLWLGALGHFVILGASFQVPKQLNWREDFAQLSRFNRKVFWTYGGFIVGTIVAFGLLAIFLHQELLDGQRSAVAISLFIGAFWMARVATDFFYFGDEDWPRGALFEIGHVALTFLFCALAILFGVVVPMRAWFW